MFLDAVRQSRNGPPEIGLDYYKARFYDPAIGRFMTPDPAGMVDGPNLYAYVLNDPVNFTDPSGLCETRTGSRICITSQQTPNTDFGGFGGRGGGTRPCTISFGDTVIMERCSLPTPRFPFGPAFPIFVGGGRGPVVGGGPSIGGGHGDAPTPMMMMMMMDMQDETCKTAFAAVGTAAGILAGVALTGTALAAAPAGVAIGVGLAGVAAGAAIAGVFGFSVGGPEGAAGAAYVGGLAVPFGRVGFAAAFSGRAATAAIAGIGGFTPTVAISSVTGFVGGVAGASLGAALCNR